MKNYLNNFLPTVLILFVVCGCSGSPKQKKISSVANVKSQQVLKEAESKSVKNIEGQELEAYVQKKGVVFGKADFQGLLKTEFVKLNFEHQSDSEKKFQFYAGDSLNSFGYFFIELPEGKYKIASVSIPVGSTLAIEDVNIELNVLPDTITYIGTLKMDGTKEKIKLGGVPVIKPGFEYTLDILDENQEGMRIFQNKYPLIKSPIVIDLMHRPI